MSKKAVVVGAGVIGLCSAYSIRERGWDVTVVDRSQTPGDSCSYGNGGMIVPSHFVPLASPGMRKLGLRMMFKKTSPFGMNGLGDYELLSWCAKFLKAATTKHVEQCSPLLRDLNLKSKALYEGKYGDIACSYQNAGNLMLCQTHEGLEEEKQFAGEAKALGLDVEILDKPELTRRDPKVEVNALGGVLFRDDSHLDPMQFMSGLRERLVKMGVVFRSGAGVTGLKSSQRTVQALTLDQGEEISGDSFVFSTGVWTPKLAAEIGLKLPLMGGRGYGLSLAPEFAQPACPAILTEARVAVTPMERGLRFVGTLELGQPTDRPVNRNRLKGLLDSIRSAYPALRNADLDSVPVWAGFRPCTPDGMPYIGRTASSTNVTLATGHAMMGLSLGPVTGELVADSLTQGHDIRPHDLLSPDRYA